MKNILTIIALLIGATVFAQELSIVSCKEKENDIDARLFSKKDKNDRTCALIKIETTRELREFTFDGAVASEPKDKEIWVYLQPGERLFTIRHETLGIIRDYPFGAPLKEATVYIMILKSGTKENPHLQYFEVSCAVEGATIRIDDNEPVPFTNGKLKDHLLPYGKHRYTVEAPLYHPESGITEITAQKSPPVIISLKPKFGKLTIDTQPEQGADVFVDGVKRGQSPLTLDKTPSGEHTVRVMKTLYLPADEKTTVSDGQTAVVNMVMKPNFADLTFNADGDIYINDAYKAAGTWRGRLASGMYKVEVRKSAHRSSFTTVEAKANETRTVTLEAPEPIYGSLNITANVTAQIYVDDKPTGETTPYLINQVLVGSHRVELRADGYQPYKQTVEVQEEKMATLQGTLQKAPTTRYGSLNINANVAAQIYVDDKATGKTTFYLMSQVVVGSHRVELHADGYQPYKQTVEVREGEMAIIQGTLQKKKPPSPVRFIITAEGVYLNEKTWGGTAAIGCRFNRHVALVAGGGYVSYSSENVSGTAVPVFVNLRINVLRTMFTPYVSVAGGACFDTYTNTDNYTDNGYTFSEKKERKATYIYYNASAGLALHIRPVQLHAGASYNNIVNAFTVNAGLTIIF